MLNFKKLSSKYLTTTCGNEWRLIMMKSLLLASLLTAATFAQASSHVAPVTGTMPATSTTGTMPAASVPMTDKEMKADKAMKDKAAKDEIAMKHDKAAKDEMAAKDGKVMKDDKAMKTEKRIRE